MQEKIRLDSALVNSQLVQSRERAKALIVSNNVMVNNVVINKPSYTVYKDDNLSLIGDDIKYVSRGGLKLEKAIDLFDINLEGCVCADIGAATGGFSDCMLQNGAKKIYCIDVGYNQLADKIKNDPRIINLEKINIRYIDKNIIHDKLDFISIDVSFISLSLVLPVAYDLLRNQGKLVCLIKPQFEAGKGNIGKNGVVKNPKIHKEVLEKICDISNQIGFEILGIDYSPIKGPEGNIEYLMYLAKNKSVYLDQENLLKIIENTVENSHKNLSVEGSV